MYLTDLLHRKAGRGGGVAASIDGPRNSTRFDAPLSNRSHSSFHFVEPLFLIRVHSYPFVAQWFSFGPWESLPGACKTIGPRMDTKCAGINRHGAGNERVPQKR